MLRHEQQTVRMALAAALHHSAGPWEKVEKQQNGAGEVHALHDGLRAQKRPLPGKRLAVPSMAGGDAIDDTSVHFLLEMALKTPEEVEQHRRAERRKLAREKEEKKLEEKREKQKQAEETIARLTAGFVREYSAQRKRKKRKKKKLPRGDRAHCRHRLWHVRAPRAVFPSFGGRPRCLVFWWPRSSLTPPAAYASCWYFTSRCVPSCRFQARDALHHGRFGPEGQLCALYWQWHVHGLVCRLFPCPVLCYDWPSLSRECKNLWSSHKCSSWTRLFSCPILCAGSTGAVRGEDGRHHPSRGAKADPYGPGCFSRPRRFPRCSTIDEVIDALVVGRSSFSTSFRARIAPHSPTLLQLSLQSSIISWADWKLMRSLLLGSDSQVIRGLHVAGELAGRVYGSRLGGNSLLDYAVLCVAMSSGGESFSPDDAYDSAWGSVMPTKGKYTINYFQYQDVVGCVCMLKDWISTCCVFCADNHNYFQFKL